LRAVRASVVAAVDLSDISDAVVASGARLAARLGGGCVVLHVLEALSGEEEAGLLLPLLRRWADGARREARQGVEALVAAHADAGLVAEVSEGRAFERVAEALRKTEARLVVVGCSHPHLALGSTAERIVRNSPTSALVIRRPPAEGYRNLLVGVDFSEGAGQALSEALAIAEADTKVTLCHALNTFGMPRSEDLSGAVDDLRDRLRTWAADRVPQRTVEVRVELGRPRLTLLAAAREMGADLLAVGPRGRAKISRLLLGSVAEAAVRSAPCDVLVAALPAGAGELTGE